MKKTEMQKQIDEAIKAHLPQQLGGALKERLEELENTELMYEELKKKLKKEEEEHVEALSKLSAFEEMEADMNTREEYLKDKTLEIEEMINNYKVKELTYQLESEKSKYADMKELMGTAFRNPVVKKTMFENINTITEYDSHGGNKHFPTGSNKDETETIE